jgi:hypothetical protein
MRYAGADAKLTHRGNTGRLMPDLKFIITDLKKKESGKTSSIYIRHGMPAASTLGVSIADLKIIAKRIKGQQALACHLY